MTNTNETPDDDLYENPLFLKGFEVGKAYGLYEAQREAQMAFKAREIDLWIALHKPKTEEEWAAWDAEHGPNFSDRWVGEPDGN